MLAFIYTVDMHAHDKYIPNLTSFFQEGWFTVMDTPKEDIPRYKVQVESYTP